MDKPTGLQGVGSELGIVGKELIQQGSGREVNLVWALKDAPEFRRWRERTGHSFWLKGTEDASLFPGPF